MQHLWFQVPILLKPISNSTVNHEWNKPFQFSNCDPKFAQNDSDVQVGFKCPNYALKDGTFKRHIKIVHEGQKLFGFEIYDWRFHTKRSLDIHRLAVHERKKPFYCDIQDFSIF